MKGNIPRGPSKAAADFILYTLSFLCLLGGFLFPAALRADEFSQVSRYSVRLFSYGTLVVDARIGDLRIEGWDEPRVEIEAEKLVRASSEAKARRLYDQIRIELSGGDKEVRLRTLFPPRRPWRLFRGATKLSVNYRIQMPYDANLVVRCVDGDVRVRGIAGHQQIRVSYGDVEVTVPSLDRLRSLEARTFLGYVQSDIRGEEGAGFGRKVSFRNAEGAQDIKVRVRLGGIYVYRGE
jgi:hypothetical protein